MPMGLRLSGRLHDGDDGVGLDGFKLGAEAQYLGGDQPLPFVYGLTGPLRYDDGRFTIAPLGAILRGDGVVPDFDAHGAFAWQDALSLRLDGAVAAWPNGWPAVAQQLGTSGQALPHSEERGVEEECVGAVKDRG